MPQLIMEIHGLSVRQMQLADIIWRIDSLEAVQEFIDKLPTPEFRQDANLVKQLIIYQAIDDIVDGTETLEADNVIALFIGKPQ